MAVDRGRYTVDVDGRHGWPPCGPASWAGAASSSATGWAWSATPPPRPGALARIVRIDERTSVLMRTADDDDTSVEGRQERVVVANVEQLVIVCALADPPPRTGFIDRCLVAAIDADIEPLLCLTKADLAGPGASCSTTTPSWTCPTCCAGPDEPLDDARRGAARQFSVHDRPLRGGQVDAGQPAGARHRPGGGSGQRDRQGPAHLDQRGRPAAGRRRLGGRHAGHPLVRHRTRGAGEPAPRLPRAGGARRRTARPTATTWVPRATAASTRGRRRGAPTRAGSRPSAACSPPAPAPRTPRSGTSIRTSRRPSSAPPGRRCASRRRPRAP